MKRPRRPDLRLALANLHRPGAPTLSIVLSFGLGQKPFDVVLVQVGRENTQRGEVQLPLGEVLEGDLEELIFALVSEHQAKLLTEFGISE